MATVKQLARSAPLSAILFLVLFLCFRYLADFSERQSFALSLFACVAFANYDITRREEKGFSPFRVKVMPKLDRLLLDYKLVKDVEECNVEWPAFWFTVLQAKEGRPGLVYWNPCHLKPPDASGGFATFDGIVTPGWEVWRDRPDFFAKWLEWSEPITGIELEDPHKKSLGMEFLSKWTPKLHLKLGPRGYELGLEVNARWWEQICAAGEVGELAKTEAKTDLGWTRLSVAMLPYSESARDFNIHKYSPSTSGPSSRGTGREQRGGSTDRFPGI